MTAGVSGPSGRSGPAELRAEVQRARREFIRRAHPDRGGDPAAFRQGLARFAALLGETAPPRASARVHVARRRRGLLGLADEVYRWWRKRSAPPRVR